MNNTNQLSKIQSRINQNNKSPEHFCDTYITTLQELKRKSNKTENLNLLSCKLLYNSSVKIDLIAQIG
jgi:hypothetical protein